MNGGARYNDFRNRRHSTQTRSRDGTGSWWANGFEMLVLGVIVGAVPYYGGAAVQRSSGIGNLSPREARFASGCHEAAGL
jgi:hypothetical protein